MTGDADPDLDLPSDLPALDGELGSPGFPLRRPLSDDDAFTLQGRDALVEVRAGAVRARLRGVHALTGLAVAGASPEDATGSPVGVERRFRVEGVSVTERVVVPRTGALCFLEWLADRSVQLDLSWSVATGLDEPRWRAADRVLAVASPPGRLLYVMSAAGAWSVDRGGAEREGPTGGDGPVGEGGGVLRVGVRVPLPAGGSVRLAVAAPGPADRESRLLRMMGRAPLAVPARRAEAIRIREQGLVVRTGDAVLDEALEWEKARAAGLVGAPASRDASGVASGAGADAVSRALLPLVAGEHRRAREALAALGEAASEEADWSAAYLFVAARYLAWTGDVATVRRERDRIAGAVEACLERVAGDADREGGVPAARCAALALRGMGVVAEELGDGALAARLKAAVGAPESGDAVACWPAADEEGALVAVVHGLLGVEPDAPKGRLVLRPRPAPATSRIEVRGLVVGSAAVELDYSRDGGVHRFALRQSRGASPLQVVLEPELRGTRVLRARVDGEPAELDPVAAEGRLRVPVQLVLDHERRMVVELDGNAP